MIGDKTPLVTVNPRDSRGSIKAGEAMGLAAAVAASKMAAIVE